MTDLSPLIERVRAASGPDRDIDGALWLGVMGSEALEKCWPVRGMKYAGHVHTKAEKARHIKNASEIHAPAYTASLDAVVALIEKRLPGADIYFEIEQVFGGWCQYCRVNMGGAIAPSEDRRLSGRMCTTYSEAIKTLPLALLLAFLTAVEGEG